MQLVLPAIATLALGTALLVPLRDDRRGKNATLSGAGAPLQPSFGAVAAPTGGNFKLAAAAESSGGDPARAVGAIATPDRPAEARAAAADAARASDDRNNAREADSPTPRNAAGTDADGERSVERVRDASTEESAPHEVRKIFAPVLAWIGPRIAGRLRGLRHASDASPADSLPSGEEVLTERSFAGELASLLSSPGTSEPLSTGLEFPAAPTRRPPLEQAAPLVLQTTPTAFQRVLPLTRLPLRAQVASISWPTLIDPTLELHTSAERHALLAALERAPDAAAEAALTQAYREEDVRGRVLALRALIRAGYPEARAVFSDALRCGTDEERALAVDALISAGDRTGVKAGFSDRIDAIAAKAALAYVGPAPAEQYRTALAPYMDAARIEVMLDLLAGIIE